MSTKEKIQKNLTKYLNPSNSREEKNLYLELAKKFFLIEYNNLSSADLIDLLNPHLSIFNIIEPQNIEQTFSIYKPLIENNFENAKLFFSHYKRSDQYFSTFLYKALYNKKTNFISEVLDIYEKYFDKYHTFCLNLETPDYFFDQKFNIKQELALDYIRFKEDFFNNIEQQQHSLSYAMISCSLDFYLFKRIIDKTDNSVLNFITKEDYYDGPIGKENIYFFIDYEEPNAFDKFQYLYETKKIPLIKNVADESLFEKIFNAHYKDELNDERQTKIFLTKVFSTYPKILEYEQLTLKKLSQSNNPSSNLITYIQKSYDLLKEAEIILEQKNLNQKIVTNNNNKKNQFKI